MIQISLKVLGSLGPNFGGKKIDILLPDGATVHDLTTYLADMGIETDAKKYLIALNGLGLHQWPTDHPLTSGDSLLAIPPLMGG